MPHWGRRQTNCIGSIALLGLLLACNAYTPGPSQAITPSSDVLIDLTKVEWIHGASDCDEEKQRPDFTEWQHARYQQATHIFRQNKCSNYEAPFVYLFVGTERALLIDTGATAKGGEDLVRAIRNVTDLPVIVAHSHGHGDHRQGDTAFRAAEAMTVVDIGADAVQTFFEFERWPEETAVLELGQRRLELLPIPGHSDDDLAIYDPISRFLVTGDTLYPGRLYINDWSDYRASILRLAKWLEGRPVSHIMGTHIEMSTTPNIDYPIGTTFQPQEHPLPLTTSDVVTLSEAVQLMEVPQRTYLNSFIIWPSQH